MKWPRKITHKFIELAPKQLEEGVLYVSIEYGSSVHKCFCGCGLKVVTPITPTDWSLIYDGETVSLWPSVGNWDYPCQSHYVIRNDVAYWAPPLSREKIEQGRAYHQRRKAAFFAELLGEDATVLADYKDVK